MASAGSSSDENSLAAASTWRRVIWAMRDSCSRGFSPSGLFSTTAASSCSCSPDTRIMKNSSRLEWKMARNFSRSSSGQCGSSASFRTRSLKASQEICRLMYSVGSCRSTTGAGAGAGSGAGAASLAACADFVGAAGAAGLPGVWDAMSPMVLVSRRR